MLAGARRSPALVHKASIAPCHKAQSHQQAAVRAAPSMSVRRFNQSVVRRLHKRTVSQQPVLGDPWTGKNHLCCIVPLTAPSSSFCSLHLVFVCRAAEAKPRLAQCTVSSACHADSSTAVVTMVGAPVASAAGTRRAAKAALCTTSCQASKAAAATAAAKCHASPAECVSRC